MPNKVKLQALKCLLSAKLYEDRIIFIDEETIQHAKTKYLNEIIAPFSRDKLMLLTGFEANKNFMLAQSAIDNLNVFNPQVICLICLGIQPEAIA